jgi:hypothetical protein
MYIKAINMIANLTIDDKSFEVEYTLDDLSKETEIESVNGVPADAIRKAFIEELQFEIGCFEIAKSRDQKEYMEEMRSDDLRGN